MQPPLANILAQAVEPGGGLPIPLGPLLGIVSGILLLGLLLWGLKNPLVWTIVSALAIAGGVGGLVWGIMQVVLLQHDERTSRHISDASLAMGIGSGAIVGGIVLLIVSLVRQKRRAQNVPEARER
jgi:hypothetical protein